MAFVLNMQLSRV